MKGDYEETAKLLEDFCIFNVEIPDFKTLAELLQWRKRIIKERLG